GEAQLNEAAEAHNGDVEEARQIVQASSQVLFGREEKDDSRSTAAPKPHMVACDNQDGRTEGNMEVHEDAQMVVADIVAVETLVEIG
ncbi:MAG: hypothetical protein M1823_008617, partial [Watsoniomyces obsoletus]